LGLYLLSGCSFGLSYQMPTLVTEMDHPLIVDMAACAMDELIWLA
jgi:homeobox-leucine zipper protein